MSSKTIIYTDGSQRHIAYVVKDGVSWSKKVGKLHPMPPEQSEHLAVYEALRQLLNDRGEKPDEIEVRLDSQVVVGQLQRKLHIRNETVRHIAIMTWNLIHERGYILVQGEDDKAEFCVPPYVTFTYIPREENPAGKLLG